MNFTQMHERLRVELLRRIQRGTVSVSLLSRQTGIGQSHLSSFLNCRKHLSLEAADRVMAAQRMQATDLLPSASLAPATESDERPFVPIVSDTVAMHEPCIRSSAVQGVLQVSGQLLRSSLARASVHRRSWQRFVAVRVGANDALAMVPVLFPNSIVLLDRHYNTLTPYRADRPTIFGMRHEKHLTFRYAAVLLGRVILRPHNLDYPVNLIDPEPGESPRDLIAGRVALVLNEI